MVRHGWDWCMGTKMATTTYFLVMSGYKFGLSQSYFSHPDWVVILADSGNSQHLNLSNVSPLVCWMVRHGWGWNSYPTTITTLQLLSRGWWKFWLMRSLRFTPSLSLYRLIQPFHISSTLLIYLLISIMNDSTRLRLVYDHWDSHHKPFSGYEWVQIWLGLGPYLLFMHPDWVCTDWFRQFTASQPVQCFTISMLNG